MTENGGQSFFAFKNLDAANNQVIPGVNRTIEALKNHKNRLSKLGVFWH
jgi:hypothetical protein